MSTAVEHHDGRATDSRSGAKVAHVPALDGLRGLAVIAVIAFHADRGWATGGFLGVDMFFVLSGFLITKLLRTEYRARSTISLSGFWSRRARRLFPALGFFFLGILVFAALQPENPSLTDLRGDMLAGLGYVANWRFLVQGNGYFAAFAPSPLRHLWSLAIEEQFYLVWPLIFLVLARAKRPLLVIAGAASASALLMAVTVNPADPSTVYYPTQTHAHGLLIGAALAFVVIRPSRWLPRAAIAAAVAMLVCILWFNGSDAGVYRGGLVVFELLTAVVIAACLHPRSTVLIRMLAWRPLRAVGLVSYGLYLWHWPVFVLVDEQLVNLSGWWLLAVQLVITTAMTVFSYFVIELPFRRGTLPGRHRLTLVPLVVGGLVALLLVVSASLDSPIARAERVAGQEVALPAAGAGALRVLLVGDSSATTLAPGIEEATRAAGFEFATAAVAGCALTRDAVEAREGNGRWFPRGDNPECEWPRTWPMLLDRYQPDVVLIAFGLWDSRDQRKDGRTYQLGTPAWNSLMERQATDAARIAGRDGALVGFLLSAGMLDDVGPLNLAITVAANETGALVFDLGPIVNPEGTTYRWDGVHYTNAGSRAVGQQIILWLGELARPEG